MDDEERKEDGYEASSAGQSLGKGSMRGETSAERGSSSIRGMSMPRGGAVGAHRLASMRRQGSQAAKQPRIRVLGKQNPTSAPTQAHTHGHRLPSNSAHVPQMREGSSAVDAIAKTAYGATTARLH